MTWDKAKRLSVRTLGIAAVLLLAGAAAPVKDELTFVRLTPEQYQHTIRNIFGHGIQIDANSVEQGVREEGLLALGNRKLALSSAAFERYEALAQRIAAQVFEPQRVATFMPCTPAASDKPDDACARQFISRVGPLLYRRPLQGDEVDALVAIARESAAKTNSFSTGTSAALVQMLVAPDFLLRVETSAPDPRAPEKMRLDAYSIASRLSFFLWDSAPDRQLLAAAGSGKLATPRGLAQEVDRMLGSPRLEQGARAFFSDMYGFDQFATLSKDTTIFPRYIKQVEDDGREQTLRTVVDHLVHKDKDYRDLYVTRATFLTPALAALYGVPLARSQELGGVVPWVPYEFPEGDEHVGVLTHVSFLALHSHPARTSPTLRGKALRENILCQKVPPPPGAVETTLVSDTQSARFRTARDRLTAHRSEPMCAGCHRITDPIGLALERFDASGVVRATENQAPIDVSGDLGGKKFTNVAQLAAIIRDDPSLTSCMITRAYSYGTARRPSVDEREWLAANDSELRQSKEGVTWREVLRRIALHPDFYTMPAALDQSAEATR